MTVRAIPTAISGQACSPDVILLTKLDLTFIVEEKPMFKFILHYYSRQKKRLIIYVIGLSLSICASLISPQIVGFFIDGLIAKRNTDFLIHFVVTFLLLQISMMLTNYLLAIIGGIVRANVSITMNFETLFHLQKLSYTFFKDSDVIYLNQRINADSNAMSSFFLDNLTILFGSLITFSFSTVYIAKLKPGLLLILLGVMLLYFLFYYILRREIYRKGHEFKETQGKYFSMLSAQLTQIL
jgi:ATP-binding cassette subfamily C protein